MFKHASPIHESEAPVRTLKCDPCSAVLHAAASILALDPTTPPAGILSADPALVLFVRHFG